jgi:GH25 family lysozyme M1 (1,4-beta-N-acetylmuramidase)
MRAATLLTAATALVLVAGAAGLSGTATAATATVPGFDVGAAQTNVDWKGAAANGAQFVWISATEGTYYQNPNFGKQSAGARAAGLIVGAAHFANPSGSDGASQADYFVDHGGAWTGDGTTLPGALDIEYNPYGAACYGLSTTAMTSWLHAFANTYRARTGRDPVIYTAAGWWRTCTGNATGFSADPLWIAATASPTGPPVSLPGGWTTWTFWQYAASGTFPGGQDLFNGTHDQLVAFAR